MATLVIDTLVFCGTHINGWTQSVEEVLEAGAAAGIDRFVVAAPKPRGYHLGPENARIGELVQAHPDRLYGLVRVDPLQGVDAVEEARRGIEQGGLDGLLLHPWEETFNVDDHRVDAVVAVAERNHVPVVVASGYPWVSEALQVSALAARHPEVPFLLTNGGQYNISGLGMQDAWSALEATPNLIVQTNGEYRQDFIERVATDLGPDRIVFASGSPQYDPRYEILRVRWADLPLATIEAMLGGTWLRLVGAGNGAAADDARSQET